jgi:hypothetical protein
VSCRHCVCLELCFRPLSMLCMLPHLSVQRWQPLSLSLSLVSAAACVCCRGCCDERHTLHPHPCSDVLAPACFLVCCCAPGHMHLFVLVAAAAGQQQATLNLGRMPEPGFPPRSAQSCTDYSVLSVTLSWSTGHMRQLCRKSGSCHALDLETKKSRKHVDIGCVHVCLGS